MPISSKEAAEISHTIIAISMVKNEQDIIESFVRHTLTFADRLLICEHLSTDGTLSILENLVAEGLPLEISHLTNPGLIHSETMTSLMHTAKKRGADLILPLDADEFILPNEPGKTTKELISELSVEHIYRLCWRRYAPADANNSKFLLHRSLKQARDFDPGQKVIIGAAAIREQTIIGQGSHGLYAGKTPDGTYQQELPQQPLHTLHLAHFLGRSTKQYAAKIATNWVNTVAKGSKYTNMAYWTRIDFERMQRGEALTESAYASDMVPVDLTQLVPYHVLTYSDDVSPRPFHLLMDVALQLAQRCAENQMLLKRYTVTTVLPYNGDDVAFDLSLNSVLRQDYPWHEVFVLPVTNHLPDLAVSTAAIRVIMLPTESSDALTMLRNQAHGDYVQLVLPGETVAPQKIKEILACWEWAQSLTDYELIIAVAHDAAKSKYIVPNEAKKVRQWLLTGGIITSGDLAAALMRRELTERCRWFTDGYFYNGALPLRLTMWQKILSASQSKKSSTVGTIPVKLSDAAPLNAEQILAALMEWAIVLAEAKDLSSGDRLAAFSKVLQHGQKVLPKVATSPLAEAYQKLMIEIGKSMGLS